MSTPTPTPSATPATGHHTGHWLATGEDAPHRVYQWWASAGIAVIAAGKRWDAIKIEGDLGLRALARHPLSGPIYVDPLAPSGTHLYALVPVGTADSWQEPHSEGRGLNWWLEVPSPLRVAQPGPHWLQLPSADEQLVDAVLLRQALRATARSGT